MKILLINNDGAGFADDVTIPDAMTIEQLFADRLPQADPADYLIRVNRQAVSSGQELCDGDRVSLTPTKIEGARCPRVSQERRNDDGCW